MYPSLSQCVFVFTRQLLTKFRDIQSVPPVWTALKELWNWIDLEVIEDDVGFDGPIKDRTGWWEQMVERLMSTCGILSLC